MIVRLISGIPCDVGRLGSRSRLLFTSAFSLAKAWGSGVYVYRLELVMTVREVIG